MNEITSVNTENEPQCKHFVTRKKRFCRMTVKKGNEYCGEHMPKSEDITNNGPKRILCPYDKKHTCYENQLRKHLKKCNAKLMLETEVPYIKRGINLQQEEQNLEKRQLSNVPVAQILEVIKKVNKLYNDFIQHIITEKCLTHEILKDELQCSEYGKETKKHIIQTSSLLGHIRDAKLMQAKTCFVEFGAGKGKLSYWIAKSLTSVPETSVLLVERASLRHKLDNKLDKSEINVNRIRADIADLVLNKVECIEKCEKIVGVTKHLCGDATDLALNCLMNSAEKKQISGIIMSFCCHHRCHWNQYTGKSFFMDNNISRSDFDVICGLVSWATCGTGKSREKNKTINIDQVDIDMKNDREVQIGLTKAEKEKVGKKCKLVLDYGRYEFLKQKGFNCSLFYYVTPDISLENVCIVAYK